MQELLTDSARYGSSGNRQSGGHERAAHPRRPGDDGELLFFPQRPQDLPTSGTGMVAEGAISAADLPPDTELVDASFFGVARRLVQLFLTILFFYVAGLLDPWRVGGSARGRGVRLTLRRAARLRESLERLGGTFIKIGQQLAIRSDVLPPIYCRELEQLFDKAEPIPEEYTRAAIERQTGKPLGETFASFDFPPIGSASVSCVYRAKLLSGETVAVKVRRPNIVRAFKTDLAALDIVMRSLEFLTILRPRVTGTFRAETRLMLLEELDFRIEVRYQELFRTYHKKRKKLRMTAPKIFPKLCGREVIVSEFVTGIWLKDMIAGVESGGKPYRRWLEGFDICPRRIAKQLIRASHYGFFECPFFHGDPHPGNILVQSHNRIVMVDFGACGVFSQRERYQLAQMHRYQAREDVGGMVQCVIGLMEPLPPIDIDPFRRRLEDAWWKGFYGIKSKHAEWWERTSFRLWSALLREVRRAQIPLPLSVLRMVRATLLYDTVAARLYRGINVFKEYRWYYDRYARRVQADMQQSFLRQLFCGPDPENYVRLRRLWDVGNLLLHQAELFLRKPLPDFASLVDKGWDLLKIFIKWALSSLTLTLAAGTAAFLLFVQTEATTVWAYPGAVFRQMGQKLRDDAWGSPEAVLIAWAVLNLFISFKYIRSAWFRLSDKDVLQPGRASGRGL
jgi:predicted unusual protein kinase regulating ubiquinone biosynthesis (AarF/ABC1/UbiB family)